VDGRGRLHAPRRRARVASAPGVRNLTVITSARSRLACYGDSRCERRGEHHDRRVELPARRRLDRHHRVRCRGDRRRYRVGEGRRPRLGPFQTWACWGRKSCCRRVSWRPSTSSAGPSDSTAQRMRSRTPRSSTGCPCACRATARSSRTTSRSGAPAPRATPCPAGTPPAQPKLDVPAPRRPRSGVASPPSHSIPWCGLDATSALSSRMEGTSAGYRGGASTVSTAWVGQPALQRGGLRRRRSGRGGGAATAIQPR
jgi:hypothetical protein